MLKAERVENIRIKEKKEEEYLTLIGVKVLSILLIYTLLSSIYFFITHRYALIFFYANVVNVCQDIFMPYILLAFVANILLLIFMEKNVESMLNISLLLVVIAVVSFLIALFIMFGTVNGMQWRMTVDPSAFHSNQTIKMYGRVINTSESNNFFPVQLLTYENYEQQESDVNTNYISKAQTFNSYNPRYTVTYQMLYIVTAKPYLLSSVDNSNSLKYYTSNKASFYETELLAGSLVQDAEKHYTKTQFPEGQTCCYKQYLHKFANQDPLMEAYTKQFVPLFNSTNVFKVKGRDIIYAVVPLRIKNFAICYQNFKFTYNSNNTKQVESIIYNALKPYILKKEK